MWSITTTYASYYPFQNSTFDITLTTFHLLITEHNSFLSDHYEQQRVVWVEGWGYILFGL